MSKYNAAYINALSEERNLKVLMEWICTLHKENVDLADECVRLKVLLQARSDWTTGKDANTNS